MLNLKSFSACVFCVVAMSSFALLAGCATIVSGKSQDVSFHSTPEGATVSVGGKIIGKTPISVKLGKEKNPPLMFELQGYQRINTNVTTTFEPWFFGNILFGGFGLLGSTTDGLSGAVNEYSPNQYYVTMIPENSGVFGSKTSDRAKVKEFVIVSYHNIISDLSRGGGEYLSTLISMLNVYRGENDAMIKKIKSLSEQVTDIPIFAERVSGLYRSFGGQTGAGGPSTSRQSP